ncbi:MAG TPA: cell division protein ZapE [Gammaproteobacteria bacterium]|nr:cell division protein ZapE [Gammaproteobacteria bacterium]
MTPQQRYQDDLGRDGFHADEAQRQAVAALQALFDALLEAPPTLSFRERLLGRRAPPVQGLYLWGGPGRGKTYLMDAFYDSLPLAGKRRVHFHRFMLEIHQALEALPQTADPLQLVAGQIAGRSRVLCLDEFHVTDVADAMLLAGLLKSLFEHRVTLVATSNAAPEHLYRDGLQRDRFLPAIDLLQRYTRVQPLQGCKDFRLELLQHGGTYLVAGGEAARTWLQRHLDELAPGDPPGRQPVRLQGRELQARALAGDLVWFDFDELCVQPRSAGDYLQLACEYHTLLLEGVPEFCDGLDEAARRFIHLVDALYDHGVKLIVTAAAAPQQLYPQGQLEALFRRTASRLTEMSSASYLAQPHRPDPELAR